MKRFERIVLAVLVLVTSLSGSYSFGWLAGILSKNMTMRFNRTEIMIMVIVFFFLVKLFWKEATEQIKDDRKEQPHEQT